MTDQDAGPEGPASKHASVNSPLSGDAIACDCCQYVRNERNNTQSIKKPLLSILK